MRSCELVGLLELRVVFGRLILDHLVDDVLDGLQSLGAFDEAVESVARPGKEGDAILESRLVPELLQAAD